MKVPWQLPGTAWDPKIFGLRRTRRRLVRKGWNQPPTTTINGGRTLQKLSWSASIIVIQLPTVHWCGGSPLRLNMQTRQPCPHKCDDWSFDFLWPRNRFVLGQLIGTRFVEVYSRQRPKLKVGLLFTVPIVCWFNNCCWFGLTFSWIITIPSQSQLLAESHQYDQQLLMRQNRFYSKRCSVLGWGY